MVIVVVEVALATPVKDLYVMNCTTKIFEE